MYTNIYMHLYAHIFTHVYVYTCKFLHVCIHKYAPGHHWDESSVGFTGQISHESAVYSFRIVNLVARRHLRMCLPFTICSSARASAKCRGTSFNRRASGLPRMDESCWKYEWDVSYKYMTHFSLDMWVSHVSHMNAAYLAKCSGDIFNRRDDRLPRMSGSCPK